MRLETGGKTADTETKTHIHWWSFLYNFGCSLSKIIDYELEKYAVNQGIPAHDSLTLHIAAVYGTEYHPEYFGPYPVPILTPWGYTLRHRCIEHGIFWLETDQCQEVLTICYPIWSASLSEKTVQLGTIMEHDKKYGINTTLGYIFFRKRDACIAIFELMKTRQGWGKAGTISVPELMNAIWQNHPGYVLIHNTQEQLGLNDIVCRLFGQLGITVEPNISENNIISLFPSVGVEYIQF